MGRHFFYDSALKNVAKFEKMMTNTVIVIDTEMEKQFLNEI